MRKFLVFFIICFCACSYGQTNFFKNSADIDFVTQPNIKDFEFESYNKISEINNQGEYQISYPIFRIFNDNIIKPNLYYTSSNIKVNDWGEEIGMGWGTNLTPVIYRSIYGIPDDVAQNKLDLEGVGLLDLSTAQKINSYKKSLYENSNFYDGEKDRFYLSIYGLNCEFIISNNTMEFFNNNNNLIGNILSSNPYVFEIIDGSGTKYIFGENGTNSKIEYDRENQCDQEASPHSFPLYTKFFISKIILGNNDVINFEYESIDNMHYINDYVEAYTFKDKQYPNDMVFLCSNLYFTNNINCLKRVYENTKYLKKISSKEFNINLSYDTRLDKNKAKILRKINVTNLFNEVIEVSKFNYEIVTSQGVNLYRNTILPINYLEGTDKRYFLKEFSQGNNNNTFKRYTFNYNQPEKLPMRFSKAQDLYGIFNASGNSSMLPGKYITNDYLHYASSNNLTTIPKGNRQPNAQASMYGLLNSVEFPTGGKELIEYEQNKVPDVVDKYSNNSDYVYNNANGYKQGSVIILNSNYSHKVEYQVDVLYNGTEELEDSDGEMFNLQYQIWDNTTNSQVSPIKMLVPYENGGYPEFINGSFDALQGHTYSIKYWISGENVYFFHIVKYLSGTENIWADYYGSRVKDITKVNGEKQNKFNIKYTEFSKTNNQLTMSDNFSMNKSEIDGWNYISLHYDKGYYYGCDFESGNNPAEEIVYYYRITSNSNTNLNHFNNKYIAYSHITVIDETLKTFSGKFYNTTKNEYGSLMYQSSQRNFGTMDNSGRNSGRLVEEYFGMIKNQNIILDKYKKYNYSSQFSKSFPNYILTSEYDEVLTNTVSRIMTPINLTKYNLIQDHSFLKNIETEEYNNSQSFIHKTQNTYEFEDGKIYKKSEAHSNSINNYKVEYLYPKDAFRLTSDQIFNELVLKNKINEVIVKKDYNNGKIISSQIAKPANFNGLILNKELYFSKDNLNLTDNLLNFKIKTVLNYDIYGNITEFKNEKGETNVIIWGYNNIYPISFIKNVTLSQVSTSLINQLQQHSNAGNTVALLNDFTQLRSLLPKSQVVSYTYKPLVGITTEINPNGLYKTYTYDEYNNLLNIKDHLGNIISEIENKYKTSN